MREEIIRALLALTLDQEMHTHDEGTKLPVFGIQEQQRQVSNVRMRRAESAYDRLVELIDSRVRAALDARGD